MGLWSDILNKAEYELSIGYRLPAAFEEKEQKHSKQDEYCCRKAEQGKFKRCDPLLLQEKTPP